MVVAPSSAAARQQRAQAVHLVARKRGVPAAARRRGGHRADDAFARNVDARCERPPRPPRGTRRSQGRRHAASPAAPAPPAAPRRRGSTPDPAPCATTARPARIGHGGARAVRRAQIGEHLRRRDAPTALALLLPRPEARPLAECAMPRVGPVQRRKPVQVIAAARAAIEEGLLPLAEGGYAAPPSRLQREEQEAPRSAARIPALGTSAADARWVEGVEQLKSQVVADFGNPGTKSDGSTGFRAADELARTLSAPAASPQATRGSRARRRRRSTTGAQRMLPATATSAGGKSRSTSSMASGGNFVRRSCRSQLRTPNSE